MELRQEKRSEREIKRSTVIRSARGFAATVAFAGVLAAGLMGSGLTGCKADMHDIVTRQSTAEKKAKLNNQLLEGAKEGNMAQVVAVLEQGADIRARNADEETALTLASKERNVEAVAMIKNAGKR